MTDKSKNNPPGDEPWLSEDLESVDRCPYCQAAHRELAYRGVEDWTFDCAPGKWDYWKCTECGSLYLDPRPTAASIGRAYVQYYTHDRAAGDAWSEQVKTRVRHTCYLAWYGLDLRPRLPLPPLLYPLLSPLRRSVAEPFLLRALGRLPPGRLIDVGCGNGATMAAARQLGWAVQGLEIDRQAVERARASGLDVMQSDYLALEAVQDTYDCLVCSHVIEHVHAPLRLIRAIYGALKPGGVALISLPNARSIVLEAVGENWRGLEAPRHLAIPSASMIRKLFEALGFSVEAAPVSGNVTLQPSLEIARRRGVDLGSAATHLRHSIVNLDESRSDIVNLVLRKIEA